MQSSLLAAISFLFCGVSFAAPPEVETLAAELESLDLHVNDLRAQSRASSERLAELAQTRAAVVAEASALDAQVARENALLTRRLRARYRFQDVSSLGLFALMADPVDLARKQYLLNRVLESDLRLLNSAKVRQAELKALEARAQESIQNEENARKSLEKQTEELSVERAKKAAFLEELRAQTLAALREKQAADQAKGPAIAKRQPETTQKQETVVESGFAAARKLSAPVSGAAIRRFGQRTTAQERRCRGIEYAAQFGAPVRAFYDGRVVFSGWSQGFGNLIVLDHGDGYLSYYAHLDAILRVQGESVARGEQLGEVGDSGSLRGTMLYFEVRHNQQVVDPARWMR